MHLTRNLVFPIFCAIGCVTIVTAQETLPTTTQPSTTAKYCPDISPCIYQDNDCKYETNIECNVSMEEVKAVFSSLTSPIEMFRITLYVQSPGDTIPADILGRSLTTFYLTIIGNSDFPTVSVDPNAFRSSRLTVEYVELKKLDMSQLDFQFLSGSTQVRYLSFMKVANIQLCLPTIPTLPELSFIEMYLSTGLNQEWQNGNVFLPNGLSSFYASDCSLDEGGMGQLMDWLIPNSSVTLEGLLFDGNRISIIPRQIRSFQQLSLIQMFGNRVDLTVQSNSFNGTVNKKITLGFSHVARLEPNAFLGDYSLTDVKLYGNLLTRFEEDVFKSMLQDMQGIIDGSFRGTLDVNSNPFDCYSDPCHLAWLLRDNRNLLKSFYGPPLCANGIPFEDLSPNLFQNCP